jgi:3-hydroxybutyryl-CoA dehydratase
MLKMKVNDIFRCDFKVSEKIYQNFIDIFEDKNPLHTDLTFAQSHGFEDKVMHGNILNGFISFFIGEKLPMKNVMILSQEIHYISPIFLNDNLKFVSEITNISESVNVVEFKFTFINAQQKKVAKGKISIKIL